MNNLAFLQLVSEKLKLGENNPIKIFGTNKVTVIIEGQSWVGDTLDQCVANIKQSFAINYLEDK